MLRKQCCTIQTCPSETLMPMKLINAQSQIFVYFCIQNQINKCQCLIHKPAVQCTNWQPEKYNLKSPSLQSSYFVWSLPATWDLSKFPFLLFAQGWHLAVQIWLSLLHIQFSSDISLIASEWSVSSSANSQMNNLIAAPESFVCIISWSGDTARILCNH